MGGKMHFFDFKDIKIIDLDVDKTKPSNNSSGLRQMHLKLSSAPPSEWISFFNEERRFPRHSMWRNAWIDGHYIVVDCVPEEIEEYHLNDLKQDITNANVKYKSHVKFVEQERARRKLEAEKKEQEEKARLNRIKGNLNFD